MKKNFLLISQILRSPWLIEKSAAEGLLPIAINFMEGKEISSFLQKNDEDDEVEEFVAVSFDASTKQITAGYSSFDDAPAGSIAVIRVKGALMKDDYCGSAGTATMAKQLKEADGHRNINGSILWVESPGGAVHGTEDFSQVVQGAKKPIVTYVDGLMASAAYWIGSSAKEIIASGKTARIGSIGTMISMRKPYGEIIEIYADDSKDKNKAYIEALNGNPTPIKEEMLNPLNDIFLASVKQNRGAKLDLDKENVLTGKVYLAEDAVKYGLIDAIGTFEYAVERVTELAKTNQSFNYNYNYSSMKFKASWAALLALVGFTASASEKDLPAVSEEHFEKFNAEVAALQAAKAALEAENARLTAEHKIACDAATDMNVHVTDLSAQVTALTAERDDWKLKAETYGAQPGALSTNPKKEKDEIEPAVSWVDPNAEHNKTLQSIGK